MGNEQSTETKSRHSKLPKGTSHVVKMIPAPGMHIHGYFLERLIANTDNSLNFECTYDTHHNSHNNNDAHRSHPNISDDDKIVASDYSSACKYVIKFIRMFENKKEMIREELYFMQQTNHSHIIECVDIFEYGPFMCVVTPFAIGGTLLDHINHKFSEETIKKIMLQLFDAIVYLHAQKIAHRDIKLNNIYIRNGNIDNPDIELADFGCATKIEGNYIANDGIVGTPVFVAPEIYEGKLYNERVDMWSLGVVMYALMTNQPPFPSCDINYMKVVVVKKPIEYPEHLFDRFSDEAKNLLRHLLSKDPTKRLTCKEALNHRWFS
ncbi:CAMK family protein kinase [Tritrichomonas foetus]|uniref:CAMK family protein kinase n=1 Tax=Tritrichomonas foetus TaxID=1144522 RepID=A0A1J4KWI7_9EUKA|nr:CAMK family protein kinase [Tritrichomonas foetus]|eukprot:OHT15649.1 CAMK family protein kinase [Tritrichomonas foetus]